MMTKSTVFVAIAFSLAIGAGGALAQNPPPAAHGAASVTNKQAVSKVLRPSQCQEPTRQGAQEVQGEV